MKQPAYGESTLRGSFSARARLSALAEERRPHGEWVKVRACEDADKVSDRTGHLECRCVILKGRRVRGQVKERVLHGSTAEIRSALTSHCDPGPELASLPFSSQTQQNRYYVGDRSAGLVSDRANRDAALFLQDGCLKWPSATANEEVRASAHACVCVCF